MSASRVINPQIELKVIEDDPDDDKILEAAIAGSADCIVSGYSHLLGLEKHGEVIIHNPDEFLDNF